MELSEALQNIRQVADEPPAMEIMCIRENKEEAIPLLMEFVAQSIEEHRKLVELDESIDNPIFALFLLAEFGVTEAFHLFAEILDLDSDKADWILGDTLSMNMGGMTASVATKKDIARIKAIVENTEIDVYQRLTAVNALIGVYARGLLLRDELVAYLAHLLDNYQDNFEFMDCLVNKCHDAAATELYERIRKLFAEDKLTEVYIDASSFAEDAAVRTEEEVLESLRKDTSYGPVVDTLEAVSDWGCFYEDFFSSFFDDEEESEDAIWQPPQMNRTPSLSNTIPVVNPPKTGRNSPCLCGSGQKYKRCCGK